MKTYMKPEVQVHRIRLAHHLMETSNIRVNQAETADHYDVKGYTGPPHPATSGTMNGNPQNAVRRNSPLMSHD